MLPSIQPSSFPSVQPTIKPSAAPTGQPSRRPTEFPSAQPSSLPTNQPTGQPSMIPTKQPTAAPSSQPTSQPSVYPTNQPSLVPTGQPSTQPTSKPSLQPSSQPSRLPTAQPSVYPSDAPSNQPSVSPSQEPSSNPTTQPTSQPSKQPTQYPSDQPSSNPSSQPSRQPTCQPSMQPSGQPSTMPTESPTTDIQWINKVQYVVDDIESSANGSTIVMYHEVVHYDAVLNGGCSDWLVFGNYIVDAYDDGDTATSVTAIGITGLREPTLSSTCSSQSLSNSIFKALRSFFNRNGGNETTEISCDQHVWKMKRCLLGFAAVCVDCWDPCSSTHRELPPMALFFNPCGTTVYLPHSQIRLLEFKLAANSASSFIKNVTVVASKYSVLVNVHVKKTGLMVYCNAFDQSPSEKVFRSSIVMGKFFSSSSSYTTSVTILNLKPVTYYNVYCTAQDVVIGQWMSDYGARATKTTAETLGPAPVLLTLSVQSVSLASIPVLNFATMTTAIANTTTELFIEVNLIVTDTGIAGECFIAPRVVSLNSIQSQQLSLSLGGCDFPNNYKIVTKITNNSSSLASNFEVIFPYGDSILVYDIKTVIGGSKPPKMTSAVFVSDLSSIHVAFDSATSMIGGASFTCAAILSFPDASSTSCGWASPTLLSVKMSFSSSLSPGQELILVNPSSLCMNMSSSGLNVSSQSIEILSPTVPSSAVVVSIQVLPTLYVSSPFTFNLGRSTGSGGRIWKSWTYNVMSLPASASAFQLQKHLNSLPVGNIATTRPGIVNSGVLYLVNVKMCNFVGICGEGSTSFSVVNTSFPVAAMAGAGGVYEIARNKIARFQVADSSLYNNKNYSYVWRIFLNGVENVPLEYISISASDPSTIQIPAFKLQSGYIYEVALKSVDTSNYRILSSSAFINVVPAAIVAQIKNGTEVSIPKGVDVVFDSSSSYDMNEPLSTQNIKSLNFSWTCRPALADAESSSCDLNMICTTCAVLTVNANMGLSSDSIFVLTVRVSSGTRYDYASINVFLASGGIPTLSASILVTGGTQNQKNIFGVVDWRNFHADTIETYNLSWTVDNPLVDLSDTALSPSRYQGTTVNMINSFNLVIPASALFKYGSILGTMTFTLTLAFSNLTSAWASLQVNVNTPPTPGYKRFTKIISFIYM